METAIDAGNTQTRGLREETRVLGTLQAQSVERIRADIQALDGGRLYKGMVRDILPGEIYLSRGFSPSYSWDPVFNEYSTNIEGPKIVRVYQSNDREAMWRFQADLDQRLYLRHPNIDQLFGVCTSQHFPALVFHSGSHEKRMPIDQYIDTLSA
ncbi:uncharacterized protein EV420DRAFT_377544 [Desarmillaria tabescens]|uniref:Protein kinase domain-containing protein n=1 Tax=Armillaria tabescens TaxID=1929756 RepID=A0AA39J289_ARMTA|nr:uncharacterized protein EV420DRAFT_377544 [Desarmillaria tabescens]KAK0434768.1 hypothetical protein EV420DRAFT_377544 [Desarmillaria tabescens]